MALRIFILGGGRFGSHLATRLCEVGCEVVLADNNPKRVEDLSEDGFHALEMDADDETALKEAGVQQADAVVVSIGENMQASILATLLLKELKVRKLIARAVDVKHAQVLEKLGADLVVLPSRDMAWQLAESLRSGVLSERLPISGEFQLAHVRIGSALDETTLAAARLPDKFGITVVLISREKPRSNTGEAPRESEDRKDFEPHPDFVLQAGDWLSVTGHRERIDKFERQCGATLPPAKS
jgi:trk system potassium uptake protein TrkA